MLKRYGGYLQAQAGGDAPELSHHLETHGYAVARGVFSADEIETLKNEIGQVFDSVPRDNRAGENRPEDEDNMFRYEMFNRSAACLQAAASPTILAIIEPLLGEDCHIIANTAWRNEAHHAGTHGGQGWHIDAGPHVPLADGQIWPKELPHPVFAIGVHIYLQDCEQDDGPTGVLPGSHLSGRFPPRAEAMNPALTYGDQNVVPLLAQAGDVGLFVSDIWHRRMPAGDNDSGRFFLQVHYGRRDIAQRVRPTSEINHVEPSLVTQLDDRRIRQLLGLHRNGFYDG